MILSPGGFPPVMRINNCVTHNLSPINVHIYLGMSINKLYCQTLYITRLEASLLFIVWAVYLKPKTCLGSTALNLLANRTHIKPFQNSNLNSQDAQLGHFTFWRKYPDKYKIEIPKSHWTLNTWNEHWCCAKSRKLLFCHIDDSSYPEILKPINESCIYVYTDTAVDFG